MLTSNDITFSMLAFPKGRLCIYTDADRPCASMLVVVREEVAVGMYACEYIRASRSMGKIGPCDARELTPIEHFSLYAKFNNRTGILGLYKLKDDGRRPTATYREGGPRPWQGMWMTGVHPDVIEILDDLYGC